MNFRYGVVLAGIVCFAGCQSATPPTAPTPASVDPTSLPAVPLDAPLIGQVRLREATHQPRYEVVAAINNQSSEVLIGTVYFAGDVADVSGAKSVPATSTGFYEGSGFQMGPGHIWMPLLKIQKKRSKPIRIVLKWRQGKKSGEKEFTIAPDQKP